MKITFSSISIHIHWYNLTTSKLEKEDPMKQENDSFFNN